MQGIKSFSKKFFGFVDFVKNYSLLCHPSILFMQNIFRYNSYCLLLIYIQTIASSGLQNTLPTHNFTNSSYKYRTTKTTDRLFFIQKNVDNSKKYFF